MTEACQAVTDFWFDTLKFPVLRAPKAVANVASRRISEKQGMRLIASEDRDYVCGRFPSEIWEITAQEWRAASAKSFPCSQSQFLTLPRFAFIQSSRIIKIASRPSDAAVVTGLQPGPPCRPDATDWSLMKPGIHPTITNNRALRLRQRLPDSLNHEGEMLRVEICSSCHPFFTGKQKLVDTAAASSAPKEIR